MKPSVTKISTTHALVQRDHERGQNTTAVNHIVSISPFLFSYSTPSWVTSQVALLSFPSPVNMHLCHRGFLRNCWLGQRVPKLHSCSDLGRLLISGIRYCTRCGVIIILPRGADFVQSKMLHKY